MEVDQIETRCCHLSGGRLAWTQLDDYRLFLSGFNSLFLASLNGLTSFCEKMLTEVSWKFCADSYVHVIHLCLMRIRVEYSPILQAVSGTGRLKPIQVCQVEHKPVPFAFPKPQVPAFP